MRKQAVRDGLTGLYNRRFMDETLAHELARARRERHAVAVEADTATAASSAAMTAARQSPRSS